MKINEKYNESEREILNGAMWTLALIGAGNAPKTQEEFDAWCDATIARHNAYEAKKAEEKAKREAREAVPGYKARRNWKRCDTEIRKMREEIERLMTEIEYHEARKAEYAKVYKAETGEEIEG